MKKVSIIIPIYNASAYLSECLDSIVKQTYKNIEVILINDGSTDDSHDICLRYVNDNNSFVLIDIENSGVSNARNIGISKATGNYLTFVDSDDIVTPDFVQLMLSRFEENVQLVACNYTYKYKLNKVYTDFKKIGKISKEIAKKELFKDDSIRGFSCNKMFVTDIIKQRNIKFDSSIRICEDLLFCFEYMKYVSHVYIENKSLYFYRMRRGSASNKNNENDLTVFDAIEKMYVIDDKLYTYIGDFYNYIFFKYYKLLKKTKKISRLYKITILDMLRNKNIRFSTKLHCLVYRFFPEFIKRKIKNIKQKNNQYYE